LNRGGLVRSQSAVDLRAADATQHRQRVYQDIRPLANESNFIKLPGVVVRDEEVVGSNPATPTGEEVPVRLVLDGHFAFQGPGRLRVRHRRVDRVEPSASERTKGSTWQVRP